MSEEFDSNQDDDLLDSDTEETETSEENIDEPVDESITSLMQIKQTDQMVIGGVKGSGKTNLGKTFTKFLIVSKCPIIIVEPLLEHKEFEKYGVSVIHIPFGDHKKFDEWLGKLQRSGWKGILIVDESDGYFPNIPNTRLLPNSNRLVHLGRHYGMGLISLTRRLARLHPDVVSQTSKLFMFRLFSRADFNYVQECQLDEMSNLIPTLGKYEFVVFDSEKLDEGRIFVHAPVPEYKD